MTNEQILEEIQPYKPSEIIMCMDLARADERGKVIGEIEEWVDNNHDINDRYFKTVALELLTTKLNSLREAK